VRPSWVGPHIVYRLITQRLASVSIGRSGASPRGVDRLRPVLVGPVMARRRGNGQAAVPAQGRPVEAAAYVFASTAPAGGLPGRHAGAGGGEARSAAGGTRGAGDGDPRPRSACICCGDQVAAHRCARPRWSPTASSQRPASSGLGKLRSVGTGHAAVADLLRSGWCCTRRGRRPPQQTSALRPGLLRATDCRTSSPRRSSRPGAGCEDSWSATSSPHGCLAPAGRRRPLTADGRPFWPLRSSRPHAPPDPRPGLRRGELLVCADRHRPTGPSSRAAERPRRDTDAHLPTAVRRVAANRAHPGRR
jgi:hypothetical protein